MPGKECGLLRRAGSACGIRSAGRTVTTWPSPVEPCGCVSATRNSAYKRPRGPSTHPHAAAVGARQRPEKRRASSAHAVAHMRCALQQQRARAPCLTLLTAQAMCCAWRANRPRRRTQHALAGCVIGEGRARIGRGEWSVLTWRAKKLTPSGACAPRTRLCLFPLTKHHRRATAEVCLDAARYVGPSTGVTVAPLVLQLRLV